MPEANARTENEQPGAFSRRGAIKAGAAIAVGATVWAEPTIKGLAKRPAYADTSSGAPVSVTVTIGGNIQSDASITDITIDNNTQSMMGTPIGNQFYEITSNANNGVRPRLRLANVGGPNNLLTYTSVMLTSGPPLDDPSDGTVGPISANGRQARFERLPDGFTGPAAFVISVSIQCAPI